MNSNEHNKTLQMTRLTGELSGLRVVIAWLWDGNQEAFNALLFFKSNYKEWPMMIKWLKDNKIRGDKLEQLCKNESPDGKGYHSAAEYILSRLKGHKFEVKGMKVDDLL